MPVLQPYEFHIIFLILCLSQAINPPPMTRILLILKSSTYPIIHVCLSISSQICCKIKLVSFWVPLNDRTNCVLVENLYRTSLLQDTTTNHVYIRILVFSNLPKPDFIGPFKDPNRYMLSSLLPS